MTQAGAMRRPGFDMDAVVVCPRCESERPAPGPQGQREEEVCWECQEREFEAERRRQDAEELEKRAAARRDRVAAVGADPYRALIAADVPAAYAALTRATWEWEYKAWPTELVTLPPGVKPTAEWFVSEVAVWPQGWTAETGWDDPRRHVDWALMLYGDFGTRKTGLATAAASNAMARGALFPEHLRFIDMCVWLKRLQRHDFAEYDRWWWGAADAPMLIFDDVGAVQGAKLDDLERGTKKGWWQYQVAELIRYRHMHVLPTIFTTNGTIGAFKELDPSLPSRLDVRLQWELEGADFRRRAAHGPQRERKKG